MVMYEIGSRQLPWHHVHKIWEVRDSVVAGQRPPVSDVRRTDAHGRQLPDSYAQLMQACWAPLARDRPPFREAVVSLRAMLDVARQT